MRKRFPFPSILALLALVAFASTAQAARPAAVQVTPTAPLQKIQLGKSRLSSASTSCQLGVTDLHFTMNYLYPPDDAYFTLLDPSLCACGGPGGMSVTNTHAVLDFPEPCSIPVTVAIVAADLSDPSCPVPIPGQYLCEPVNYDLEVTNAGGYDFLMPLEAGCCITQKAFLQITFREVGDCGGVPSLYVSFLCDPCTSWNDWPGGAMTDLCDGYLLGNPTMYVDASCCGAVPTLPKSWGSLKTTYR
jgi:hypothetical protein